MWVREDGKQAYLGGYSTEEEAAEAHDVAALKCHGLKAKTNFHISRCFLRHAALHRHQGIVLHAREHVPPARCACELFGLAGRHTALLDRPDLH